MRGVALPARPGILDCVSSLIYNVGANLSDHIQGASMVHAATIIMNPELGLFFRAMLFLCVPR